MRRFLFFVLAGLGASVVLAQEATDGSVSQKPLLIDEAIFFVETDAGSGISFLMEGQTGGVWMVSTSSVFERAKEYSMTNASGDRISFPEQVMVAADRDLISFPADRSAGLKTAKSFDFEENILTFSKCDDDEESKLIEQFVNEKSTLARQKKSLEKEKAGASRGPYADLLKITIAMYETEIKEIDDRLGEIDENLKALEIRRQEMAEAANNGIKLSGGFLLNGNVVALGPDRIEVSSVSTKYDRGGPVLNKNFEVIGVTSYSIEQTGLPDWVTEGTRFESIRRFALRPENVEWMPLTREAYQAEASFIQENLESLMVFAQITESLADDYLRRISVSTENKDIQGWLDRHNKLAEKYSEAKQEIFYSQSQIDKKNKYFNRNAGKDLEAFAEMIEDLEKDAGRGHRVSIPYYKERLVDLEQLYSNVRERIELITENF